MTEAINKVNVYTCGAGHRTVTRNAEEGVTPFMISCKVLDCNQMATSEFYRVDQGLEAEWEWYHPDPRDVLKMDEAMQQYLKSGEAMLLRRVVKTRQKI